MRDLPVAPGNPHTRPSPTPPTRPSPAVVLWLVSPSKPSPQRKCPATIASLPLRGQRAPSLTGALPFVSLGVCPTTSPVPACSLLSAERLSYYLNRHQHDCTT